MGSTPKGNLHIERALTDMSLKYSNGALIADIVCPRVSVAKESDKYFLYGRSDFSVTNDVRADGAKGNRVDPWIIEDTPNYQCEEHQLEDVVTDRMMKNADQPLSPDMDATDGLAAMLALNRENVVATLYTTYANYATSGNRVELSGTEQWNNAAFDSDSKTDAIEVRIDNAKEAIRQDIGMDPNTIIIPSAVAKVMKRDEEIRKLIKWQNDILLVNGDLPPTIFNMKVVIPGGIKNNAEKGQTYSGTDVWGKHVILCYLAPNPRTPRVMTFGMTFENQGRNVLRYRDDSVKGNVIDTSEILVEKIVSEYAGYMIKDAIS